MMLCPKLEMNYANHSWTTLPQRKPLSWIFSFIIFIAYHCNSSICLFCHVLDSKVNRNKVAFFCYRRVNTVEFSFSVNWVACYGPFRSLAMQLPWKTLRFLMTLVIRSVSQAFRWADWVCSGTGNMVKRGAEKWVWVSAPPLSFW